MFFGLFGKKKKKEDEKVEVKEDKPTEEVKEDKVQPEETKKAEKPAVKKQTAKKPATKKAKVEEPVAKEETKVEVKEETPAAESESKDDVVIEEEDDSVEKTEEQQKKDARAYHISRRKEDGKWIVRFGGSEKIICSYDTQVEAIARAKELAKRYDHRIVIHKVDGKIRKQKY